MKILIADILQSKAQTLINTVNCVGVMGKGIALEFKEHFPEMYEDYVAKCEQNKVKPGIPYIYQTLFPPQIINFPTKDHWKSISKISDIENGLKHLLKHYKQWGVKSLAIPPLGCGNGQLEWKEVGPLIYKYVKKMDIPVEMYAPYGTPPKELTEEFLSQEPSTAAEASHTAIKQKFNPAWIALVEILSQIEKQPYHYPVGRTVFQKIAYVATRQGLPTGFNYVKSSYGPFCSEMKNALSKLANNNLLQEQRLGKMFIVKVGPNYDRVKKNFAEALSQWNDIIDRTTDLFLRMNTDRAEITATVMYAADSLIKEGNQSPTETEVLNAVIKWKQKRKPPLDKAAVASAIRNLAILRWLNVKFDPHLPVPEDELATA